MIGLQFVNNELDPWETTKILFFREACDNPRNAAWSRSLIEAAILEMVCASEAKHLQSINLSPH